MSIVLLTGGAGYIGTQCCVTLIDAGLTPIVLDNFSNADRRSLDRVEAITGSRPVLVEGDLRDPDGLDRLFAAHDVSAVIHLAALKSVGESVSRPLAYFDNNVHGTITLLSAMKRANVKTLVFSSSATVYGDAQTIPISEHAARSASNPYGRSKLIVEDMLGDLARAEPDWRIARLRYFNPVGAHESGLIGEDPNDIPNNLMPFVAQVAVGSRDELAIFGDDYPTHDGTGVRDYIHVIDLAIGHLAALRHLQANSGMLTVNLGTGRGYSVLDVVAAFERASGRTIPYRIAARRPGDVAACYADPSLAEELLGWRASRTLDEMCADVWRWQERNPQGYASPQDLPLQVALGE